MDIKNNIRSLRKSRGLTQVELAKQLGTTQKVITDYETGKSVPPHKRLVTLSQFFNVSISELVGENELAVQQEQPMIHKNTRTSKMIDAFEELSPTEQRALLNQAKALAERYHA